MDCLLDPFLQQHIVFSISSNKKFAQWPHSHIPRGLNPRSRGENTRHGYYESLRLGSSPLTRGKRDWDPTDPRHPRLIPAHAGKTTTVVGGVLSVAAHPRSRGENDVRDDDNRPFLGSSPLTRGKRSRPTRAGRGTSAHPRSRGENGAPGDEADVEKGSSPLTRGKPPRKLLSRNTPRLIPAHAGKTPTWSASSAWTRAHPRSRGENIIEQADPISPLGSSPLTRGKRPNQKEGDHHLGLIPAHAGKTPKMGRGRRPAPAHPRSRGENPLRWPLRDFDQGSSPLTRGKRSGRARSRLAGRLIPAHAGKTHCSVLSVCRGAAHPRSRGENVIARGARKRCGGSSPLTRGKRCTHHDTRGYLRLVPAHAGKTRTGPPD